MNTSEKRGPSVNILLLNYEYPPVGGGGGYVCHNVAKRLVQKGHSVTAVTATFRHLKAKEEQDGVIVYRVPSLRKKMERTTSFEMLTYVILCFFFLLMLRFRRQRFDVAHIHFALPTGLLGPWVRLLFGIEYLLTIHGTDLPGNDKTRFKRSHEISKPFLVLALGNAAHISVVTPKLKELALNVLQRDNISVLSNGVNTQRFYLQDRKRENLALFVGRLIPIKSPGFIIANFPAILKKVPDVKLLIAGHGYLQEKLEAFVKKRGLQDRVEFIGWVDHNELPELYSRAKVFFSLQKHDNFGSLAMLEAMACGLPVVASRVGATTEQIRDGETGFTISPGNRKEFVEKMVYLLTKDQERERISRNAAELVADQYCWEKIADQYEKVLLGISKKK